MFEFSGLITLQNQTKFNDTHTPTHLKSFYITIYRDNLCFLNVDQCGFYSTNTSSNLINIIYFKKNVARELQNTSLIQTRNEIYVGARDTKNTDSFFILICAANSLKLAFYQIKSNLKMLFSAASKTTLYYINEK